MYHFAVPGIHLHLKDLYRNLEFVGGALNATIYLWVCCNIFTSASEVNPNTLILDEHEMYPNAVREFNKNTRKGLRYHLR